MAPHLSRKTVDKRIRKKAGRTLLRFFLSVFWEICLILVLLTQVRLSWLNILSTGTVGHQKLALCFISLSKIQKTYLKPKAIQRMPECPPLKWDWHPSMYMDLFRFLEFRSCLVLCMRVDKASYTLYSNHRKRFKKQSVYITEPCQKFE